MRHLSRIALISIISSFLMIISCGDDKDESGPDLSEVEFSFDTSNPPVDPSVVNNLLNNTNQNVQQVGVSLSLANALTSFLVYFSNAQSAASSTTPIGSCGGEAIVYTYSSTVEGETFAIAYQLCELSNKYVFQIFTSDNGVDFELYINAEESKADLREGFLEVYNIFNETETEPVTEYEWKENVDGTFDFEVSSVDFVISVKINADNSGSLSYELDGNLWYAATWSPDGSSGTYIYYNTDGTVSESGSWP